MYTTMYSYKERGGQNYSFRIDIAWVIITAVASKVGRGVVSELQTLQSSDISLYPLYSYVLV